MKKLLFISALALVLGACAPKQKPAATGEAAGGEVGAVVSTFDKTNWTAMGKIALAYPSCGQGTECSRRSMSGTLRWEHRPGSELIQVFDPMGKEHLGLTYQPGGLVEMREANKAPRQMTLPELSAYLTIPLPLDQLPQLLVEQRNEEKFEFDGWQVENSEWQGHFYRSVKLRQKDYFIKIIVNEMTPN